jgi:hypothetical protein
MSNLDDKVPVPARAGARLPESARARMAPPPTSLVYRLRGLPPYIGNYSQAAELLSWAFEQKLSDIEICSLATITVNPWTGTTKTATVMFKEMPRIVQDRPYQDEWTIMCPRLPERLLLDSHFRGMTPLHDILPPHEHKYRLVTHWSDIFRILLMLAFAVASPSQDYQATHSVHGSLVEKERTSCGFVTNFHSITQPCESGSMVTMRI